MQLQKESYFFFRGEIVLALKSKAKLRTHIFLVIYVHSYTPSNISANKENAHLKTKQISA